MIACFIVMDVININAKQPLKTVDEVTLFTLKVHNI